MTEDEKYHFPRQRGRWMKWMEGATTGYEIAMRIAREPSASLRMMMEEEAGYPPRSKERDELARDFATALGMKGPTP